jgi:GNAT superfamily N-acetyltransferase
LIVELTADDPRLAAFHAGIYWDAFAAQHEPLDAWRRSIARGLLTVRILEDETIRAGICFERYPKSGVGLVTYMVVAPEARGQGIGERLLRGAVEQLGGLVLGEVNDPRRTGEWKRLERFERWGARVLDARYIQPALGEGLSRDRGLLLIAFAPIPSPIEGVRAFVEELYAMTEGGPPDPEVSIPDQVPLIRLR